MNIAAMTLLLALLVTDARAVERAPADPLAACQVALARAGRKLGDRLRGEIGACLALGVGCLTADGGDRAACCTAAAARCRARVGKIAKAKRRYVARLRAGRCARVRFGTVTAADGLGFESAAQTCSCLDPDAEVRDLSSLGACLARLSEVETTRLLAVTEAPRAPEALKCAALDGELATLEQAVLCAQPSPTPDVLATASATAATTPHPTVTASQPPLPTRTLTPASSGVPTSPSTASAPPPSSTPTVAPSRTATSIRTASRTATAPPATAARTITPTPQRTPVPTVTPPPICGNGIVEGDEECDGNAFDDSNCADDVCTCEDFCDDAGGRLGCRRNCTADFSRCTADGCEF